MIAARGWSPWPVPAGIAAAVALGGAVFVERVLGIAPCELCLLERWPWRAVLVAAFVALLWSRARRALRSLAMVALLVSLGLGVLHSGVEWHAWPSPFPSCHAPAVTGGSIADQLAALPARAAKPCDAATFLVPGVPVSLAEADLIWSVAVLLALWRGPVSLRRRVGRAA